MSEEEDYDDEGEEEEEEEGEEEEGEDEDEVAAAAKDALVKEDISMILDIFAYIDRTSKRMASRLELESAMTAPPKAHNFPPGVGMNHELDHDIGIDRVSVDGGAGGAAGAGGFQPSWSNYENLTEAERGMLLEKAIMTLGEQPQQVVVQTEVGGSRMKRK